MDQRCVRNDVQRFSQDLLHILVLLNSNKARLLLGSGVVTGTLRHQGGDKGSEQGFAPAAGVVHELEEAEIERQLVLRDAPVWAEQERSKDHVPSIVLTWISQKPSPSSSRAYSPRAWHGRCRNTTSQPARRNSSMRRTW